MKIRVSLCSFLCAVAVATGAYAADEAPAASPQPNPGALRKHDDQTELGSHMEKLSGAYRKLSRQVADASKNEDSLKLIATIRAQAEEAIKLKPAKTADVPEADRAAFVAKYQEEMKEFIAEVEKVETALKANRNEEAATLVKKMKKDSDEAHKEFRKKKDRM